MLLVAWGVLVALRVLVAWGLVAWGLVAWMMLVAWRVLVAWGLVLLVASGCTDG